MHSILSWNLYPKALFSSSLHMKHQWQLKLVDASGHLPENVACNDDWNGNNNNCNKEKNHCDHDCHEWLIKNSNHSDSAAVHTWTMFVLLYFYHWHVVSWCVNSDDVKKNMDDNSDENITSSCIFLYKHVLKSELHYFYYWKQSKKPKALK